LDNEISSHHDHGDGADLVDQKLFLGLDRLSINGYLMIIV
jgi:hypothetical protein